MNKSVSVVIPVFKNEGSILKLIEELQLVALNLKKLNWKLKLCFVIDGSPDNSEFLLLSERKRLRKEKEWRVVRLSRNYGQIPAILAGLQLTDEDHPVVVMSADLQDPPKLILELIHEYTKGNDLVILNRVSRDDGFFAKLTSRIAYSILRIENTSVPVGGFDFFLISGRAKSHLLKLQGRFRFFQGDVVKLGFPTSFLSYHREPRLEGASSYTFGKRLQIFIDAFIDSSYIPIKLGIRMGLLISFAGVVLSILSLLNYFRGESPFSGFTAIFCSILLIGGLQLILIGLIGEYLYRTYDSSRGRPLYIVEEIF